MKKHIGDYARGAALCGARVKYGTPCPERATCQRCIRIYTERQSKNLSARVAEEGKNG